MPENRCELVFIQSGELSSSTKPLRVITQYSSADDLSMQSPGRPTTLGVCLTAVQNNKDGKMGSNGARISCLEENSQPWSAKMVDNGDFEKLLGQLGSNGSTPVTPTSFLNPRNITEDQEMFADNFSRTLNKVKAEQEGWAAAACGQDDGSVLRPHSHSPVDSLHVTVPTFGDSRRANSESTASSETGPSCANTSRTPHGSNQVDPSSPRLIDQPLVLSSATSLSSALSQIRTTSVPVNDIGLAHSSSATLLSTTEFDLSYSSASAMGSATTNTTWTTGLPTILSIASGLKDVYADRGLRHSGSADHNQQHLIHATDIPISMHVSSPQPVLFSLDSRNGVNGERRSTDSNPTFLLRYTAIPDTHRSDAASPPNGSGVSLHNSQRDISPVNSCALPSNPTFTTHEGVYSGATAIQCSDSSLTSSLSLLPSIISTVHSPQVGLIASSVKPPPAVAFLLTASPSSTPGRLVCSSEGKQSSYATVCARMAPCSTSSSVSSVPGLSTDAAFSRIVPSNSSMSILQENSTGALLINSNSQLQQLTTLYPNRNGTLGLAGTDDLQQAFAFHPTTNGDDTSVGMNFGTTLTSLPEVSSFGTNSQTATTTTTTANDTSRADLVHLEVTNGSTCRLPSFPHVSTGVTMSQATGLDGTNTAAATNPLTPMSVSNSSSTGSHLTSGFTNLTSSVATSNAKKPKRSAGGRKARARDEDKTDMSTSLQPITSICDSSASANSYLTPNPLYSPEPKKLGLKRPRESCGLQASTLPLVSTNQRNPVLFPTLQSDVNDETTYLHPSLTTQLVYLADTDHPIHVKTEATVPGEAMDDVSTHSESISADLGGGGATTVQSGQTPPSSVDGLDQNHLKLERKRARNRVAARRCRERKISLIRALENQVAERDAHVRCLEDLLARYRSEGERLRKHMELLANSYPSLKAELYQYPFLFQHHQQQQQQQQ